MNTNEKELICLSDVEVKPVEWLWYPYIPYGKITIIQGDPGEGKTMLSLNIAALLSQGGALPGDSGVRQPINIIYNSAEDGLADTIKPRLLTAGADCTRILTINETVNSLSMTDERIEKSIKTTGAKLVILDPMQGYIGSNVDLHRANEIRPIFSQLGRIAEENHCAVVLIGHLNKTCGQKAAYRGLGSVDITAAARSVLFVGKSPKDKNKRFIYHSKSSLAPNGKSIVFEIVDGKIEWGEFVDFSAEELLEEGSSIAKIDEAKDFLLQFLSDGAKPQTEIQAEAENKNFGERTLREAKTILKIKSFKEGKKWYWKLP